jgi:hypothetical protein
MFRWQSQSRRKINTPIAANEWIELEEKGVKVVNLMCFFKISEML